MTNWNDKVVLVTGAARGIGRAVAEAYAACGASMVLVDRESSTLTEVPSSGSENSSRWLTIMADIRQPDDIQRVFDQVDNRYGRLDVLINNAGISVWKSPLDLTVAEWDDVMNTNLRGTFLCAREAAKRMENSGRGAIVNIASTRALMSEPNSEAYAASKGGIVALTHALALSLGPLGIRVNSISPGWIETGDYLALRGVDHEQHPAGRVGRPDDVARACLFLTDPSNDFITGENLVLDGGMTRRMIYEP